MNISSPHMNIVFLNATESRRWNAFVNYHLVNNILSSIPFYQRVNTYFKDDYFHMFAKTWKGWLSIYKTFLKFNNRFLNRRLSNIGHCLYNTPRKNTYKKTKLGSYKCTRIISLKITYSDNSNIPAILVLFRGGIFAVKAITTNETSNQAVYIFDPLLYARKVLRIFFLKRP